MAKTTVKVANTSLMALLDKVNTGGEVTIEKDGRAVARLISTNSFKDSRVDSKITVATRDHTFQTVDEKEFQQLCDAYASAV
jgi:antitoxin (DNA-binding transcriptional repressor) of toxin-antitoxin stability system